MLWLVICSDNHNVMLSLWVTKHRTIKTKVCGDKAPHIPDFYPRSRSVISFRNWPLEVLGKNCDTHWRGNWMVTNVVWMLWRRDKSTSTRNSIICSSSSHPRWHTDSHFTVLITVRNVNVKSWHQCSSTYQYNIWIWRRAQATVNNHLLNICKRRFKFLSTTEFLEYVCLLYVCMCL